MSFEEVDEVYESNLALARQRLLPNPSGKLVEADGVWGPPPDERAKLRRAHKAAVELTKRLVGADAWRDYRDAQTRLGAPEFVDGEAVRRGARGGLRVDRLTRPR